MHNLAQNLNLTPKRVKNELSIEQKREICSFWIENKSKVITDYRKELVSKVFEELEATREYALPDIKESLYMLVRAWRNVTSEKIVNCWRKVDIIRIVFFFFFCYILLGFYSV